MRHSGGEYTWIDTARAASSLHMRCTWEASNSKAYPARLDDLALDDADGPARQVVVMKAGVVAAGPRDDPDVDVVVAPQLLEVAGGGVGAHERPPAGRIGGDARREVAQLVDLQVAAARGAGRDCRHCGPF